MRAILTTAAALLLVGCVTTPPMTLAKAEYNCREVTAFERYAACIQSAFNTAYPQWPFDRDADALSIYFRFLQDATRYVQIGTVSEDDAKTQAVVLSALVKKIGADRNMQARQAQSAALTQAAAIWNASLMQQRQSVPAYLPPSPESPKTLVCTTNEVYGSLRTVCH